MNHINKAGHIEEITDSINKLRELVNRIADPDLQNEMKFYLNHLDERALALFVAACGV